MRLRRTLGIRAFDQHIGQCRIHRLRMLVEPWHQLFRQPTADGKITTGASDTTFTPDANCTRAQIVTFLYRMYQGK